MRCYRIGSGLHPVFDGAGAALFPGRWNSKNQHVIYCGGSFAIAMLERLCYAATGALPEADRFVEIRLPDSAVEVFDASRHPGWAAAESAVARSYGSVWYAERRSLALVVPSVVTMIDSNVVLNQRHPGFDRVTVKAETPVAWDKRLFRR